MPGVPVPQSSNNGLQDARRNNDYGGANSISWREEGGQTICSHVGTGE